MDGAERVSWGVQASRAMLESGGGGDFSAAMVNSILLALWAILPALAVAYARQRALAPRRRPEFMLQKSERSELKRAVELGKFAKGLSRYAKATSS